MSRLTLKKALKTGKLESFINQEEKDHPAGDAAQFKKGLKAAIKPPRSKRQTSRSRGGGN